MRDEVAEKAIGLSQDMGPRAAREKTWDECGIEERMERLRDQQRITVRIQGDRIEYLMKRIGILERHQHNQATGEVLAPVNGYSGGAESVGRMRDQLA